MTRVDHPDREKPVNAFLWGVILGAFVASASIAIGCYLGSCSLHVTPDPYTPPTLVIEGSKPIMDGGSDD